jgi:hypothetical protein
LQRDRELPKYAICESFEINFTAITAPAATAVPPIIFQAADFIGRTVPIVINAVICRGASDITFFVNSAALPRGY